MSQSTTIEPIKTLPWGEKVYKELPIYKKSANKFYARHGETSEGRQYIEFSKFGPKPNTEGEMFVQKLRIFNPLHWLEIKHYVENDLVNSIGWNLADAKQQLEETQNRPKVTKTKE